MGMYSQTRRIGRHDVKVRQLSVLNFEVVIDNGAPTYFQPHRYETLFNVIRKAIESSSMQMNFEGITNEN